MRLVGLADCNSFFASCEKLFRPDLANKPVVVLSSNDGCIVALSKEAKEAGIVRGLPYFQAKDLLKEVGAVAFSSNFVLYQNISDRVMGFLKTKTEDVEVYSIDEAFFRVECSTFQEAENIARNLSKQIKKAIGIPVSIGIARTKTLAKIANHAGKKKDLYCVIKQEDEENFLKDTPIDDIWGIGYRSIPKLEKLNIKTAWEFINLEETWIKQKFSITGANTYYELRGIPAIGREENKNLTISSSISFPQPRVTYNELHEAIACHCRTICEKLNRIGFMANDLAICLITNRFKEDYTHISGSIKLPHSTNYIPEIIKNADIILKSIYKPLQFKSVRVVVWNLSKNTERQFNLFDSQKEIEKIEKQDIMANTISKINKKNNVYCAASNGLLKKDLANKNLTSPLYTTKWSDIPVVGRSDKLK